ncbi:MAG: hypothetical protein Q9181_001375 [Wetmoreana brouardii]
MPSHRWQRLEDDQGYELNIPAAHTNESTEEVAHSYRRGRTHSSDNLQKPIPDHHGRGISFKASPNRGPSHPPLGKPTVKKRFHILHVLAASISLICFALAVAAVANENISWRLGRKNYQLIVLGFLLGIMNLCLGSVAPTTFLHLEARYGSSTLQNYNGILRNESTKEIDVTTYIRNTSYYGMFAPPGLQLLGEKTGVSLFSNATLPFAVTSSQQNGSEPPLPTDAQAYGFNILLLNNESAAVLDIPQPSYVSAVQSLLAGGESWNISAPVFATVAAYNHSRS